MESDPVEKLLFDSIADALVRERQQRNLSHVVSPRVALLCSKSVSTILPGFMVNDIVYQDISTFAEEDFVGTTQPFGSYGNFEFESIFKGSDMVLLKRFSESCLLNKNDKIVILANELQIHAYLGKHQNIIESIGLTLIENNPCSVYCLPNLNLNLLSYSKKHPNFDSSICKSILNDLTSAFELCLSKGILINNFSMETVNMVQRSSIYDSFPMLMDLSCACHITAARPFPKFYVDKFRVLNHLPSEISNGNQKPTHQSDIYSFGVMIRRLAENITNDDVKQILFSLSFSLMNNVRTKLPNTLYKYLA